MKEIVIPRLNREDIGFTEAPPRSDSVEIPQEFLNLVSGYLSVVDDEIANEFLTSPDGVATVILLALRSSSNKEATLAIIEMLKAREDDAAVIAALQARVEHLQHDTVALKQEIKGLQRDLKSR